MSRRRASSALRIAPALILALGSSACGGQRAPVGPSGPAAAMATATTAATPTVPADPREAVLSAMRAQRDAPFVRNEVATTIGGATTTRTIERVLPDRYRLTADDGSPSLVVIGDRGWMQAGDRWVESPVALRMAGSLRSAFYDAASIDAVADDAADFALVGVEDVQGGSARRYRYVQAVDTEGVSMTIDTGVWVRRSDGLPVQVVVSTTSKGATSVTSQRIGYDAIVIAPPPP